MGISDQMPGMPSEIPDPLSPQFDFSALMRTGLDPMSASDESIPMDPTSAQFNFSLRKPDHIERDQAALVGLATVLDNLAANRDRLVALSHLPTEMFLYALRFQKLRKEVEAGNVLEGGTYFPDHPPESLFSSLNKSLRDCIEKKREFPALSREELASYLHVAGAAALGNPDWIGPSIEAFSASVLFQSWQIFEFFAEDVLNAAVRENRTLFPKTVKLPIEFHGGLNGKKTGIRIKFRQAFVDRSDRLSTILKNEHLDYVAALRNLFAHNSGKTDADYLKRVKRLSLRKIIRPNIGDKFPLTGAMVQSLGDHCLASAYQLLYEVCIWLRDGIESRKKENNT
jgi:hypothetical protein